MYNNDWFPIQDKLGVHLEPFFRHYLAIDGKIPNIQRIYSTFRDATMNTFLNESERETKIHDLIKKIKTYSGYYTNLLHPQNESVLLLREGLRKINRLRLTTSYPLLLNLYHSYKKGSIEAAQLAECLKLLETYIVRRAVCGVPTNVLNRYFPTVYQFLKLEDIVGSLRRKLAKGTGSSRMPKDDEFRKYLTETSLYRNRILRYILGEIEKYDNKEVVTLKDLQIEHIMPQTLTDNWRATLGENWGLTHSKYLDTLGNLTLTGYNPEYSNRSFDEKRDMEKGFRDSGLQINRSLAMLEEWNQDVIEKRAKELADIAMKIWRI